ncbi:MAG TPA: MaoC/PaaZ C-terminal domain-containing protein, partial [Planctomycetota bacterium]|nr:MaoC/PaaZ C-terminal domain-containing protein [Planctomycetota bacterium]
SPRAKVLSIDDKGSGQLMTIGQTLYAEGEKLIEMESRLFFRGESKGDKAPAAPPPAKPKADRTFELTTAQDLPKRYAVVSGDDNPIHLDENLAKSVGFKGVILHGLSTLALVVGKMPKPMTRLEVRFNKPVYPGEVLTTSLWNKGDLLEFETTNAAGEIVLANGKAVAKL